MVKLVIGNSQTTKATHNHCHTCHNHSCNCNHDNQSQSITLTVAQLPPPTAQPQTPQNYDFVGTIDAVFNS